jgi:peptide/nickel transport system permease protein
MFGVTVIIVLLLQLLDPAQRAIAFIRSPHQLVHLQAIIQQYGLDKPFYVQYWNWLMAAVHGNLGYSRVTSEPVLTTIVQRFPRTAQLAVLSIIPVVGVGIWLGTAAALHRDKFIDQFTRVLSIFGWSLPTFVLGIWLLVIFYGGLNILPPGPYTTTTYSIPLATGDIKSYTHAYMLDAILNWRWDYFWDAFKHMILPVITLSVVLSAQVMRVMRGSLLDVLNQDYVRTARSKGLPEQVVNYKHARRNALIPVLTLSGFVLIGLLSGVVITETIFNYPGLGQWVARAATQLDYASVMGFALLAGFVVTVANLLVDIMYALVDPRIRYS